MRDQPAIRDVTAIVVPEAVTQFEFSAERLFPRSMAACHELRTLRLLRRQSTMASPSSSYLRVVDVKSTRNQVSKRGREKIISYQCTSTSDVGFRLPTRDAESEENEDQISRFKTSITQTFLH